MQSTLYDVDMNCGMSNPAVALAVTLSALSFGALMAGTLMSKRSYSTKACFLALVFASSFVHSALLQGAALWAPAAVATSSLPGGVGCIGRRVPSLLGPAAALLLALMGSSAWWLWRRVRPPHAS